MAPILYEYIATKLLEDIRSGRSLPVDLCQAVTSDMRRRLHQQILPTDFAAIRRLCETDDSWSRGLGINLLFSIVDTREARSYLEELWRDTTLSMENRRNVQFRLLDCADLDATSHEALRNFTFENWEEWLQGVRRYAGGAEKALEFFKARIIDSKYVESKLWVYLCCGAASNDKEATREWLQNYTADTNAFRRDTALLVLARL